MSFKIYEVDLRENSLMWPCLPKKRLDIPDIFDNYLPIFVFFVEIDHEVFQEGHTLETSSVVRSDGFCFDPFLGWGLDVCISWSAVRSAKGRSEVRTPRTCVFAKMFR